MKRAILPLLLLLAVAFALEAAAEPPARRLKLKRCRIPEIPGETVRCGTYEVFENRGAGTGRKIALRVVVIPARKKPVAPDPLVFFEGGPGGSAIDSGAGLMEELSAVLQHRDILLVDARGTGGSGPLNCPGPNGPADVVAAVQETLDRFHDAESARRCRAALEKDHDLTQYTSETIVDDVNDVRAALGYAKVNLLGASYGTRAAQVYLKRHPETVRTVILEAVVPIDSRIPRSLPRQTETAFERTIAACAADRSCRAAFPFPRRDLEALLGRLEVEPEPVTVRDEAGKPHEIKLSRNGAAQTVRYLLYRPGGARLLPLYLREAAAGNIQPLGQVAWDIAYGMNSESSDGLYLSVTCAEDVAFVDRGEALQLAFGTFIGDARLRQQTSSCDAWPAAKLPASFLEPVRSAVPALLVAGENDPATPPDWAQAVAAGLTGSRLLVIPNGAHSFDGLEGAECVQRLATQLVETGSAEGLDLDACRAAIKPPPFSTTLEKTP